MSSLIGRIGPLAEGVPCGHPGCLSHASHPCEGCGRIPLRNGQVYYDRDDTICTIAQRLLRDVWVLLRGPVLGEHGGTYMTAILNEDGQPYYTEAELQAKLEQEGWRYTKARLIVVNATVVYGGKVVYISDGA